MKETKDHMAIVYEIATIKFKQRGLTTNGKQYKTLQQEIFSLLEQKQSSH